MIAHIVQSLEIYNIFQNKIFLVPTGVSRYSDLYENLGKKTKQPLLNMNVFNKAISLNRWDRRNIVIFRIKYFLQNCALESSGLISLFQGRTEGKEIIYLPGSISFLGEHMFTFC